jgi:hypothetical protein
MKTKIKILTSTNTEELERDIEDFMSNVNGLYRNIINYSMAYDVIVSRIRYSALIEYYGLIEDE